MDVILLPTAAQAAELAALLIRDALVDKPRFVLGLATGRTMERVYGKLAVLHRETGLDFSDCTTFNLDEYVGLAVDDPGSYQFYMRRHLFDRVNLNPAKTHVPDGADSDLESVCHRYEAAIAEVGGIDLQLLGIGNDGHIGFNEPLSSFRSRTRVVSLTPATIKQNAGLFATPELMPRRAITMGVGTILDAKRCVMLATGAGKAEIVAAAVEGPMTAMVSASALQWHPNCTVILDEDAGAALSQRDHYRWVFENDPAWMSYR